MMHRCTTIRVRGRQLVTQSVDVAKLDTARALGEAVETDFAGSYMNIRIGQYARFSTCERTNVAYEHKYCGCIRPWFSLCLLTMCRHSQYFFSSGLGKEIYHAHVSLLLWVPGSFSTQYSSAGY